MLLRARGGLGNVTIMSSVCLHLSDHVLVIYRSHLTSLSICTLFTPSSMAGSRGCFHEVVVIQRWSAAQLTGLQESGIRLVPQACMGGREQCPHADDPAFHTLRLCFIGTPPISWGPWCTYGCHKRRTRGIRMPMSLAPIQHVTFTFCVRAMLSHSFLVCLKQMIFYIKWYIRFLAISAWAASHLDKQRSNHSCSNDDISASAGSSNNRSGCSHSGNNHAGVNK